MRREKKIIRRDWVCNRITIGDLAGFLFKLTIAGIVVAFPFAVIFLFIALAAGWIR